MAASFTVEPDDLKSAASSLKSIAGNADASRPVGSAAREASMANRGFFTSNTVTDFAECFEEASKALEDRITNHADAVDTCAKAYEDTNTEVARPFGTYLTDLGR